MYIARTEYPEYLYKETIDPLGSGREYEETETEIPTEDLSEADRLSALEEETEQNTADIDYIAMACAVDQKYGKGKGYFDSGCWSLARVRLAMEKEWITKRILKL